MRYHVREVLWGDARTLPEENRLRDALVRGTADVGSFIIVCGRMEWVRTHRGGNVDVWIRWGWKNVIAGVKGRANRQRSELI
jgi:hypothetical protein